MIPFQTKTNLISGSSIDELESKVKRIFKTIKGKTKRRPYIRSAYFKKEKIFFDFFWDHLNQKSRKERTKRIRYFSAAIDLIENCRNKPTSKDNPNRRNEKLHRFYGLTREKYLFCVQIKENKNTGKKELISIYPPD